MSQSHEMEYVVECVTEGCRATMPHDPPHELAPCGEVCCSSACLEDHETSCFDCREELRECYHVRECRDCLLEVEQLNHKITALKALVKRAADSILKGAA